MSRRGFTLARLGRRSQFFLFETFVLIFGLAAAQLIDGTRTRWTALFVCMTGYALSFLMLLTTRCERCAEPVGLKSGRLVALPYAHCTKCGADLG